MKADIHPKVVKAIVHCGCGATYETLSTRERISVDVCAACHPFYTGTQRFIDTEGRVEKFQKRFGDYRTDATTKRRGSGTKAAKQARPGA
jgi:large subunit ribosomal protein L31